MRRTPIIPGSAGAFLAALILSTTITGLSALDVRPLPQFEVDANTQALLRGVADDTLQTFPPRVWCPADA